MASASSRNAFDNYNNTEIEQDLIDPDDGILQPIILLPHILK